MNKRYNDIVSKNIHENIGIYFTVTLFFAIGIAAGAFTIKALDSNKKQDLVIYLNNFFQILNSQNIPNSQIFLQSLKNNFQTVFFIWLLSITIIGVPVTLFVTTFRGFIVGFTIAFLIEGLGWKGLIFTSIAVLPQNILYIPCLLIISAFSLAFSLQAFRQKIRGTASIGVKNNILSYTVIVAVFFIIMSIGSAIEAYLSPVLIKSLASYMIYQ
ncbi:stage II sporulation protein M [Caloramator quimbayensis]|uniref:Stage II sporulation protein M n=1 Tax=Caloramator quimbayensis TaxID=1147123 RepID=A0A1T4WY51_9CLOT|nr:stage II sporulation protein M [Caloramator quimbayensis]SKA82087.1 stage II sporulation protein M [Caloramator quimbayensis]